MDKIMVFIQTFVLFILLYVFAVFFLCIGQGYMADNGGLVNVNSRIERRVLS